MQVGSLLSLAEIHISEVSAFHVCVCVCVCGVGLLPRSMSEFGVSKLANKIHVVADIAIDVLCESSHRFFAGDLVCVHG